MRRSKLLRGAEATQHIGSAGQWTRRAVEAQDSGSTAAVDTQGSGKAGQWTGKAVETQGVNIAEMRGQWQRMLVLLQKCGDSANAGQLYCGITRTVATQGSFAA